MGVVGHRDGVPRHGPGLGLVHECLLGPRLEEPISGPAKPPDQSPMASGSARRRAGGRTEALLGGRPEEQAGAYTAIQRAVLL
ncbi:TPA: hypothetical protein EYP44_03735, partial [Candidatus Bathyarchaeota archaeon]|nr:hypothetical protein [Candidatus Bathyarchaeota archaeon]